MSKNTKNPFMVNLSNENITPFDYKQWVENNIADYALTELFAPQLSNFIQKQIDFFSDTEGSVSDLLGFEVVGGFNPEELSKNAIFNILINKCKFVLAHVSNAKKDEFRSMLNKIKNELNTIPEKFNEQKTVIIEKINSLM